MAEQLTFAIPFYRGLDYLRLAVESVIAQEHEDWRLLVCDDSEESCGVEELVAGYGDSRIRYHRGLGHVGMVANWNRCLDEADSELVTLLHADDRVLPHYAQLMLAVATRHPEAAAFHCGAEIVDARGRGRLSVADSVKHWFRPSATGVSAGGGATGCSDALLHGEPALRALMAGNFIMCPTLCYRAERLAGRRFSERWKQVQDLEFTTRLLMEGEALVGIPDVAYAYRRHEEAATALHSESFLRFDEEFELFERVAEKAEELGWHEAAALSRRKTIVKLHLLYRALRSLLQLQPRQSWQTLRYLAGQRRSSGRPT